MLFWGCLEDKKACSATSNIIAITNTSKKTTGKSTDR